MSLALRLFPLDYLSSGSLHGYSHTVLELGELSWDLGGELREAARRLPDNHDITAHLGSRIPDGHYKGEHCYGALRTDAYGEPYRWLTARELIVYLDKHWPKHPVTA